MKHIETAEHNRQQGRLVQPLAQCSGPSIRALDILARVPLERHQCRADHSQQIQFLSVPGNGLRQIGKQMRGSP